MQSQGARPTIPMPEWSPDTRRKIEAIAASYEALAGRPLVAHAAHAIPAALWSAPAAIVAHGTEPDPIFFFGNATALRLFELSFEDFTRLPSRLSAEPMLREERASLLDRVTRLGIIGDYCGVRISATGRRFRITNATVWNLTDSNGRAAGQAAAFSEWTALG